MRAFLSYCYPPMLYPRAIQIARLVGSMEAPPVIYCAEPDRFDPVDKDMTPPGNAAIERVTRAPWDRNLSRLLNRVAPGFLCRPDANHSWARRATRHVLRDAGLGPTDVLTTFSSPVSDHLAGLRIKRRTGCRWIAAFSDPWVDNPFFKPDARSERLARIWEREVLANADRVVFSSQETVDLVMRRYPESWRARCRVIEHSFSPRPVVDKIPGSPLIIRFLGNLYGERSVAPVIAALAELAEVGDPLLDEIRLELIGHVQHDMNTFPGWERLPEGLVTVCPSVSYARSLELMDSADLLLVMDAPGPVSPFLPSKLVEYVGSGVPIAGVTPPGTAERVVRELGGPTADPSDPAEVACTLKEGARLARNPSAWRRQIAPVRERYRPDHVAADFESVVRELEADQQPSWPQYGARPGWRVEGRDDSRQDRDRR